VRGDLPTCVCSPRRRARLREGWWPRVERPRRRPRVSPVCHPISKTRRERPPRSARGSASSSWDEYAGTPAAVIDVDGSVRTSRSAPDWDRHRDRSARRPLPRPWPAAHTGTPAAEPPRRAPPPGGPGRFAGDRPPEVHRGPRVTLWTTRSQRCSSDRRAKSSRYRAWVRRCSPSTPDTSGRPDPRLPSTGSWP